MERRLTAILAADVVGYSRLMGANESGTLVALDAPRTDLVDPKIAEHQGRIVKLTGDGIVQGEDIFGDGVNVAARLESIATPGGITISGPVRDHIGNRLDLAFEDMGEQTLKNIERPIRVYRVCLDNPAAAVSRDKKAGQHEQEKPAIAVLPFNNMSGDPEQEYFSDGITEDIITDLSKVS